MRSFSNVSTTALCWAAFTLGREVDPEASVALQRVEAWLRETAGSTEPAVLAEAIARRYGKDRTFSVPILTTLALAGLLGKGAKGWRLIPQLPFELAALPRRWFRLLNLQVVSYALPALIAMGQARHRQAPSRNPLFRWWRNRAVARTLRVLESVQPRGGGFLEATPLTSFVAMSLSAAGHAGHVVVQRCTEFLERSQREEGSWPIDTNLATWVSTLAVNALAAGQDVDASLGEDGKVALDRWLQGQQWREIHPYTDAPPGGFAWTDLDGGVPDADDTPGALLALWHLGPTREGVKEAAVQAIGWLLDLQNSDGGIPTFCRGWGKLPFDRSSPDLTAHVLRAWVIWEKALSASLQRKVADATQRALEYLSRAQRLDGAFVPLWFGNQHVPGDENPTYGTARVLAGLAALRDLGSRNVARMTERGLHWLVQAQHESGGFGGDRGAPPTVEETALAVQALVECCREVPEAAERGARWLIAQTERGQKLEASPIGFYFAKLWYYEELYPRVFALGALGAIRARREGPGRTRTDHSQAEA